MVETSGGGKRLLHLNLGPRLMAQMRNELKHIPRGVLVCKSLFIILCLVFVFEGKHPPASAQVHDTPAEVYGLQIRSADQDRRMDEISTKQAELNARMSKQWDSINANTNAISGFQGETRGIGALLVLLQIGSMVWKNRSKGSEGSS